MAVLQLTRRLITRRHPARLADQLGLTLAETCIRLGPVFIKLGQILSTRQDLLGTAIIEPLGRLVDDLPAEDYLTVQAILASEFGRPTPTIFASFDPTPIGSGSIACVYHATTRDGRSVAVKVQRPKARGEIDRDLRLLELGARVLSRLPAFRDVPIIDITTELSSCLRNQLDFRREASAQTKLREALAHEHNVLIPNLVTELCTDTVLTMGFIDGLMPIGHPDDSLETTNRVLLAALNALYRMIFVEGFVHCDLHSGNLYRGRGGTVVILDFGFTAQLSVSHRLAFAEFFYALATDDGDAVAELTLALASKIPCELDRTRFSNDIRALVHRYSARRAHEFSVAGFASAMFAIQRRHHVRSTTGFIAAVMSLAILEGLIRTHIPNLDFQERAKPYLLRASIHRYNPTPPTPIST